jgi:flagellar hook protein FlgE
MSDALLSGVSGLQVHQTMLDVAGNNLANVNTTAFKASRVSFAELLSETLREASQPNAQIGGTNPVQVGSGVLVSRVDRDVTQGSMFTTGQPLDMAIEGGGYFVLNDGNRDLYTRMGSFAVDGQYYLVDPATGFRVKRIGSEGVADGFQSASNNAIRIPYDVPLPAKATTQITYTGNLSADQVEPTTNLLTSGIQYTKSGVSIGLGTLLSGLDQSAGLASGDTIAITGTRHNGSLVSSTLTISTDPTTNLLNSVQRYTVGGAAATGASLLSALDQASGLAAGDTIRIQGTDRDGTSVDTTYTLTGADTLNSLLAAISAAYAGATPSISNGEVLMTDAAAGASQTTLGLTYDGDGTLAVPESFTRTVTGGQGTTLGDLLTAIDLAFANPTDRTDHWSTASLVNGEISLTDSSSGYSRTDLNLACSNSDAIELPQHFTMISAGGESCKNTNIEIFDSQGIGHVVSASFVRTNQSNTWDLVLTGATGDVALEDRRVSGITFLPDGSFGGLGGTIPDSSSFQVRFASDPTNVRSIALNFGSVGEFNGLSQFGGTSTVTPNSQDGYASGWLSSMSVSRDGTVVGLFSNGIRRDLASICLATFQNPAGLQSAGNNYFESSPNSGVAVATKALLGGAGELRGGSLEKSNVNTAVEFVNLMQAQNGFQANARTIKTANDMLQELTNLMR